MSEAIACEPQLAPHLVAPAPRALLAPSVVPPLAEREAEGLDLILEGFLLHHGRPRLLDIPDGGQRVLAGDYCYAQGLARVTESGDLFVVDLLSALISEGSGLVARGSQSALPHVWAATTLAIADPELATPLATAIAAQRAGDGAPLGALGQRFDRLEELTEVMVVA